jgi:hypothetical protein
MKIQTFFYLIILAITLNSCSIEMWENTPTRSVDERGYTGGQNFQCPPGKVYKKYESPEGCYPESQENEECKNYKECVTGLICNDIDTPATCTPLHKGDIGERCRFDNHCEDDLICYRPSDGSTHGTCNIPNNIPEDGFCKEDKYCEYGLVCDRTQTCAICERLNPTTENLPLVCSSEIPILPLSMHTEEYGVWGCRVELCYLGDHCMNDPQNSNCNRQECTRFFEGEYATQGTDGMALQFGEEADIECSIGCNPECDTEQTYTFICDSCDPTDEEKKCEDGYSCLPVENGDNACVPDQCSDCMNNDMCVYIQDITHSFKWCTMKQCL